MIIIFLLILFLLIEGIGTIFPREIIPYFYFFLPTAFFFYLTLKKKAIFFPTYLSIVYGFFLLFSFISTIFFSVDKQISFESTLFYLVAYMIFIFFYNNKELAKKYIKTAIIGGSIIFLAVYLFNYFNNLTPSTSYQLVFPYFATNHNHLGDFLGLILVTFVYQKYSYLLLLFFPFFLISFSRSAFFALFVTSVLIMIKNKIKRFLSFKIWLIIFTVFLTMIFFVSSVKEAKGVFIIGQINRFLAEKFQVTTKEFTGGRTTYLQQGWQGFKERPFFGVGPGNFEYISKKYSINNLDSTDTVHSLFPEILFENGELAFIFFLVFIILITVSAIRKNRLESYLLLYLLINFQSDYTYRIYAMFVLFMILAAIVYEEKKSFKFSFGYAVLSIAVVVIGELILASWIFLQAGLPKKAFLTYPLNKSVYPSLIDSKKEEGCSFTLKYANIYHYVSPGYLPTLEFLSKFYEGCGDKKMALKMIEEAVGNNKFISFTIAKRFYFLKKDVEGKGKADQSFFTVFEQYQSVFWQSKIFENEVREFCRRQNIVGCRFQHFWQPEANSIEYPNPELSFSKVTNKLNADGLNDRFNYPVKKPKDTFRIMVLGGSEAYGLYVETKDNWTELLEDLLNKNSICSSVKKIEVINLGMHGYDISYSIERFELKGRKYKPDMIIFLTPSLYILNEEIQPKMDLTLDWQKAFDQTIIKIGEEKIFSRQKELIKELRVNFPNEITFIRDTTFNEKEISAIRGVNNKTNIFEEDLDNNKDYFYQDEYSLNRKGHEIMAERISKLIDYNKLCLKR